MLRPFSPLAPFSRRRFVPPSGGGSWVPTVSIPLNLYLDGDGAGSLGSSVSNWPAGAGTIIPATQSTSGKQPTVVAGLNGHQAVMWDGVDDALNIASFPFDEISFLVVVKCNSAGYNAILTKTIGNSPFPLDDYDSVIYSGPGASVTWNDDTTSAHVVVMQAKLSNGSSVNYWLDGAPNGSGTCGSPSDTGNIIVGNRDDGATVLNGSISVLLQYQGLLTSGDVSVLSAACKTRFGTP